MIRPLILTIVVGAALTTGATASSYRDRDVRTTVVRVGDLDLASGWGVDRTIRRVRSAIDGLCDDDERCRDEAWLSADWQVARNMAAAQYRRRIADERAADRARYGWDDRVPDGWREDRPDIAPPPPPPVPAPPIATVTTTTTTTTTTTITLAYRTPPPDYGWYPR